LSAGEARCRLCAAPRRLPRLSQRRDQTAPRDGEGGDSSRPFKRWRWVAVDALVVGRRRGLVINTVERLIARGWVESDGNGRVRPTELFPADLARALTLIGEPV
jgi:hypothetical protein